MELIFRAYAGNTTTALGILTHATAKRVSRHYNGPGTGAFRINRHSSQFDWCAPGNYVRVYIDSTDNDPIFAFFIESGEDQVLSRSEQGDEDVRRGGRGAMAYLERAVIDHTSTFGRYVDGSWLWTDATQGRILKELIDDAQARGALPLLTYDFTVTAESGGGTWQTITGTYELPVGLDLLAVLARQQSAGLVATMSPEFVLSASEEIGDDLSATVIFTAGDNISEEIARDVLASAAKSRMLVQGASSSGVPLFRWVNDATVETALGDRREGFVSYQAAEDTATLDRVGQQAIRRLKRRHDGLSVLGVLTDELVPFTDYFPGDTVTIDVPDVWDELEAPITSIVLFDADNGEAECALEFEDIAFEPLQLNDRTETTPGGGGGTGGNTGGGGGRGGGGGGGGSGGGCSDCPPFAATPCAEAWDSFDDRETVSPDWDSTSADSIAWTVENINNGGILGTPPTAFARAWVSGGIGYMRSIWTDTLGLPCAYVESGPAVGESDWEVLFRFRVPEAPPNGSDYQVILQIMHEPAPTTNFTYVASCPAPDASGGVRDIAGGAWYLCRFERESGGPTYRWKLWLDGAPEPAAWTDTEAAGGVETAFGFVLHASAIGGGDPPDTTAELHFDWIDFGDGCEAVDPSPGQAVSQSFGTSNGTTTEYRTRAAYMPGSLQVYADDIREWNVTETDPAAGDWEFDTAPFSGETVRAEYRAAA